MSDFIGGAFDIFILIARAVLPVLVVLFLAGCARKMLQRPPVLPIARLVVNGMPTDFEIKGYECSLGRSRVCDVRLNIPSISRRHAVLSYNENYGFKISAVNDAEILVNGIKVEGFAYLQDDDTLTIGGVEMTIEPPVYSDMSSLSKKKRSSGLFTHLVCLTFIQLIVMAELMIHYADDFQNNIPITFLLLVAVEWVYCIIRRKSENIHVELIGFLLTSFGLAIAASAMPSSLMKQFIAFMLGFAVFVASSILMKNLEWTMKARYVLTVGTVLLFALNLIIGKNINGAKNWIVIGPMTVQPSELLKYAFVFVGASSLDRLLAKRNVLLFLVFAGVCIGSLALMRDFGTASIYFITTLIVMFMRSGDLKAVTAVSVGAGAAATGVAMFVPYVKRRFATYRHVWEYASDKGYQQTRTMIAIASGGLFGLGGGNGNLDRVAAADTDLVFGLLCEEWGLIVAVMLALCFVLFAVYTWRRIPAANSAFYAIAACAAAGLYIFQISLNIFGSTDLLPLTGVTMPFISNGGSSMIASWALLSFIKAVGENCTKPDYDSISDFDESDYVNDEYEDYDGENQADNEYNYDDFKDISSKSNNSKKKANGGFAEDNEIYSDSTRKGRR